MLMRELIEKKREGVELAAEEIDFIIRGYTSGEIPDYQASAWLMAVCFQGMTRRETLALTLSMLGSGETLDLSAVPGICADKHSTGGVGDKTSIALIPLLASAGVNMAKMSGRGLGHTGGTIDKLSSFPGLSTAVDMGRFMEILREVGCVIAEQTAELAPADKKLYALRDVTGTVESLPLIVSSIMSKKLAAGAHVIVLDVKAGSGAFMRSDESAIELAREMVEIGRGAGRKVAALVTDMDEPLGYAVGNALEVREAISVLRGESAGNLRELTLALGALILTEAGLEPTDGSARLRLEGLIDSGAALNKLAELVRALGGAGESVYDVSLLPKAPYIMFSSAEREGYVDSIETEKVGLISQELGGGRAQLSDTIDPSVGLVLRAKRGDFIRRGDALAEIHARNEDEARKAAAKLSSCYSFSDNPPERREFVRALVR